MKKSEGIVSYSSLSKFDKEDEYVDDFVSAGWEAPKNAICLSSQTSFNNNYPYQSSVHSSFYDDGDTIEGQNPLHVSQPEINLKNVLSGIFAILIGRNKSQFGQVNFEGQKDSSSNVSFLEAGKNGDTSLHSSVYTPSAPPLLEAEAVNYGDYREILVADPPERLPDSSTTVCMQCSAPFTAFTRGRHHCRFCGGIFCRACTKGKCLLPVKFRQQDPQRVCDTCYDRLDPLQGILIHTVSNASQTAKHDVMDWTCTRGWLNLPVGLSMEDEIYKASNALRTYYQAARIDPEKSIPYAVLNGAKGLAILTVAKAGAILTYKLGTGLVVARRSDGSWSAPSAILSFGLGWGAQIGGELTDFIIVLHGSEAVKTFCGRMHFSFGAGLSAAAGPIGRVLEADLRAGDRGSGMCYTYSCSKGAFVGVSLEGSIVMTRTDTNLRFYGDPYLSTSDILLGNVGMARAAQPLYSALDDVYSKLSNSHLIV